MAAPDTRDIATLHAMRYTSLNDLSNEHSAAHSFPRQPNFFLSLDWYECLFETALKQEYAPRIYIAGTPADESGLLCLAAQSNNRLLRSMSNYYSMEFGLSVPGDPAKQRAHLDTIIAALAGEQPRCSALELHLLREDLPITAALETTLSQHDFAVQRQLTYKNWFVATAGQSFADYFAARPSQLKNTVTRKEKKLRKEHAVVIKVLRTQTDPDFERGIADYIAIYNSSWKRPEPYPQFIPGLIATCARLGILRLGIAYVDETPAAAQLWINTTDKALIYKLAYDERFAQLSVGSVLTKEMFRIAIDEDRTAEIDYGIGDDAYKRDWMAGCRTFCTITAYNRRSLRGRALLLREAAKRTVKTILRR